jgi:AraC family transcriptional regulator of arabinose operon
MHIVRDGFLYAGVLPDVASERHSALIYVALPPHTFALDTPTVCLRTAAALVRPGTPKRVRAGTATVACIDVCPPHRAFRTLSRLPEDVRPWPRDPFAACIAALQAFVDHRVDHRGADQLHQRLVDAALAQLPAAPAIDPRVQATMQRLHDDARLTPEQLADAAGLSKDWLLHLFQREAGVSLRQYAQTLKLQAAAAFLRRGIPLADVAERAGFAHPAHFSRCWKQRFGFAPHRAFMGNEVRIDPPACALEVDAPGTR